MKNKPEKYTWYEFLIRPIVSYVIDFTSNMWDAMLNLLETTKVNFLGYWYCNECGKLHSPRVKKYRIKGRFFFSQNVCSLHREEDNHDR